MTAAVRRCCFSDAVGRRAAGCSKAQKSAKQYRRMVHCRDADAHAKCAAWLDRVRQGSRFSFGITHSPAALPRRTAAKLQCAGLLGLGDTLEGGKVKRIDDVSNLLRRAVARYGSLDEVPLVSVTRRLQELDPGND